ncbi:MAG TPA: nitroreductase family protein, partial [Candidatus Cloacimonas sp.]|nr:nitroreductase family protein [Candidatus Cloacimonas sp.]
MNEMIAKRRSIRKYQSDPIGRDVIERILAAGFQAPSALGKEPWEFLVVTDQKAKEYIANMSAYAWMASSAPVVILVLA